MYSSGDPLLLASHNEDATTYGSNNAGVLKDDLDEIELNATKMYTIDEAIEHGGFGRLNITVLVCTILMWSNVTTILLSPAILPDLIRCSIGLTKMQTTTMIAFVYVGYFIGNIIFGTISDRYGRKSTILLSTGSTAFFSLLFSFADRYSWTVFFQATIAMMSSGMMSCNSLCLEFLPTDKRSYVMFCAICNVTFSGWYSLISWTFLDHAQNWQWVLRIGHVLPIALSFPVYYYLVPESPRYLSTIGKTAQASEIFKKLWKVNKVEELQGQLVHCKEVEERGSMLESLRYPFLSSTILLSILWMINGLTYFGGIFLVTKLNKSCQGSTGHEENTCITSDDLLNIFLTSFGDLPGIFLCIPLMERWGRRITLAFLCLILSFSLIPLYFCQIVKYSWIPVSFVRAAGAAIDGVLEVYVPEVYPTYFRNAAVNTVKIGERIGMIATPFLSQWLITVNYNLTLGILTALTFASSIIAACLPRETANKKLVDVQEQNVKYRLQSTRLPVNLTNSQIHVSK